MSTQKSWSEKLLLLLIWCIFLLPLLFLFLSSFAKGWRWPGVTPDGLGLQAWQVLIQDPQLQSAIGETVLIGGLVVILNLILAIPGGKALAHYDFVGKSTVETLLMLPIIIPALMLAMSLQLTLLRVGLANRWIGVTLIHLIPTLPYSMRSYLKNCS